MNRIPLRSAFVSAAPWGHGVGSWWVVGLGSSSPASPLHEMEVMETHPQLYIWGKRKGRISDLEKNYGFQGSCTPFFLWNWSWGNRTWTTARGFSWRHCFRAVWLGHTTQGSYYDQLMVTVMAKGLFYQFWFPVVNRQIVSPAGMLGSNSKSEVIFCSAWKPRGKHRFSPLMGAFFPF